MFMRGDGIHKPLIQYSAVCEFSDEVEEAQEVFWDVDYCTEAAVSAVRKAQKDRVLKTQLAVDLKALRDKAESLRNMARAVKGKINVGRLKEPKGWKPPHIRYRTPQETVANVLRLEYETTRKRGSVRTFVFRVWRSEPLEKFDAVLAAIKKSVKRWKDVSVIEGKSHFLIGKVIHVTCSVEDSKF